MLCQYKRNIVPFLISPNGETNKSNSVNDPTNEHRDKTPTRRRIVLFYGMTVAVVVVFYEKSKKDEGRNGRGSGFSTLAGG